MAKAPPVLDLSTLIERPTILIDEKLYAILSPDELSVLDSHHFVIQGKRLDELERKSALTDTEKAELSEVLRAIADKIMVGVPAVVRNKLSDAHRRQVAEVFTQLPARKKLAEMLSELGAKKTAAPTRSTGAKRSPGSSGSTAATRKPGSRRSRSPSSKRTAK